MIIENLSTSVAVCTFNGEKYIEKQLKSIINQSIKVDEIVICDDGSVDNTVEIATKVLSVAGIKFLIEVNKKNLGVTRNFEKCISLCSGDIVFISDQDDIWNPNKVEKFISKFLQDDRIVLSFSNADIIDAHEKQIFTSLYGKDGFINDRDILSEKDIVDSITRLNYTIYGCTMAARLNFLKSIMPFYVTEANHDAWIMVCAGLYGKISYIPDKLIHYRIHGYNQVGTIKGNPKWDFIISKQDKYDRHFNIHSLKDIRIDLFKKAINQKPSHTIYSIQYINAINYYDTIKSIKSQNILQREWKVLKLLARGCYRYRFNDRNKKLTSKFMFKQLAWDIIFLARWNL